MLIDALARKVSSFSFSQLIIWLWLSGLCSCLTTRRSLGQFLDSVGFSVWSLQVLPVSGWFSPINSKHAQEVSPDHEPSTEDGLPQRHWWMGHMQRAIVSKTKQTHLTHISLNTAHYFLYSDCSDRKSIVLGMDCVKGFNKCFSYKKWVQSVGGLVQSLVLRV